MVCLQSTIPIFWYHFGIYSPLLLFPFDVLVIMTTFAIYLFQIVFLGINVSSVGWWKSIYYFMIIHGVTWYVLFVLGLYILGGGLILLFVFYHQSVYAKYMWGMFMWYYFCLVWFCLYYTYLFLYTHVYPLFFLLPVVWHLSMIAENFWGVYEYVLHPIQQLNVCFEVCYTI